MAVIIVLSQIKAVKIHYLNENEYKKKNTKPVCFFFFFKITVQTPDFRFHIQCQGTWERVSGQLKLFHSFCPHISEDRDHDIFQSLID